VTGVQHGGSVFLCELVDRLRLRGDLVAQLVPGIGQDPDSRILGLGGIGAVLVLVVRQKGIHDLDGFGCVRRLHRHSHQFRVGNLTGQDHSAGHGILQYGGRVRPARTRQEHGLEFADRRLRLATEDTQIPTGQVVGNSLENGAAGQNRDLRVDKVGITRTAPPAGFVLARQDALDHRGDAYGTLHVEDGR